MVLHHAVSHQTVLPDYRLAVCYTIKGHNGGIAMYDTHASFHSVNGKRLILIVEDVELNREILASILENSYEIIFGVDGTEALERIESHKRVLL